jgi:hypothetical protein
VTQRKQPVLSAQVLLRSASGKQAGGGAAITAANIGEYLPSSEAVAGARKAFAERGFQVGNVVGNSFAITASGKTFEKVFHTRLRRGAKGEVTVQGKSEPGSYELPLGDLPKDIARFVEAVTFTPPPDFGPTSY